MKGGRPRRSRPATRIRPPPGFMRRSTGSMWCALRRASPPESSLRFARPELLHDLDRFDEECRRGLEPELEGFGHEYHRKGIDRLVTCRKAHAGYFDHPLEAHQIEQLVLARQRRPRHQRLLLTRLLESEHLIEQVVQGTLIGRLQVAGEGGRKYLRDDR